MTQQLSDFTFAPDIAGLPFLNRSQTWGLITSIATPFCNVSRGFCSIFNSNVMQSNNLLFVWLMYNEDVLNDSILFRKNNPNWIVGLPPPIFLPQILPINRWWLTSIRLTVPKKKQKVYLSWRVGCWKGDELICPFFSSSSSFIHLFVLM